MTTCDEYRSMMSEFLDDELAPARRSELSRHLDGCPSCLRELESIRHCEAQFRQSLPVLSPPAAMWRAVRRGVKPYRHSGWWRIPFLRPISVTLATLLAVTGGIFLFIRHERGETLQREMQAFQFQRRAVVEQGNPYRNRDVPVMAESDENPFSPYIRVRSANPFKEMD